MLRGVYAAFPVERLLRDLAGRGITIVLVTHDLAQARRVAERAVLVVDGTVRAAGGLGEVERAWRAVR